MVNNLEFEMDGVGSAMEGRGGHAFDWKRWGAVYAKQSIVSLLTCADNGVFTAQN